MNTVAKLYEHWLSLVPTRDHELVRMWLASCGEEGLRAGAKVYAGDDADAVKALVRAARSHRDAGLLSCCIAGCKHAPVAKNVDGDLLCRDHLSPFDVVTGYQASNIRRGRAA